MLKKYSYNIVMNDGYINKKAYNKFIFQLVFMSAYQKLFILLPQNILEES